MFRNLGLFLVIAAVSGCSDNDNTANPDIIPVVNSISPNSGTYGTIVSIKGSGFWPVPELFMCIMVLKALQALSSITFILLMLVLFVVMGLQV